MNAPVLADIGRRLEARLAAVPVARPQGRVTGVDGVLIECSPMNVRLGERVRVLASGHDCALTAEVVALRKDRVLLMAHGTTAGLCLSSAVIAGGESGDVAVGDALLGRVVDAAGHPLDDGDAPRCAKRLPAQPSPSNPLARTPVRESLETGIRAIDLFTPVGRGQRIGLFAGSGVGKSTLLGMLCRHASADVVVVALVGERGREVAESVDALRAQGSLARSVVVAAAADQPAVLRRQSAWTATAIAEHFRAQGRHVLLVMDSLTRFAQAQREIGLAIGEPMAARGYPPSVFGLLSPLIERAGNRAGEGSITGIYTVLVDGDDLDEPVSDALRATLDGHVVLDRALAERGHFPAIDVVRSISRVTTALHAPARQHTGARLRRMLATYRQSQDLVELGAWVPGSNPALDAAVAIKPALDALLQQEPGLRTPAADAWRSAEQVAARLPTGIFDPEASRVAR